MKYQFDDNDLEKVKKIVENSFDLKVKNIKLIGSGNDSYAYDIDNFTCFFMSRKIKKEY